MAKNIETDDTEIEDTDTPVNTLQNTNVSDLGAAIGAAVAKGINDTQHRKITIGEYNRRYGLDKRPRLKLECRQNGYRLTNENLDDRQIELLNQITHSGRYINRLITVVMADNGEMESEIDIRWNCKTADQRMELKGEAKNFTIILEKIVEAQKEERAVEARRNAPPSRPHFGKKMAEAQEAAEV